MSINNQRIYGSGYERVIELISHKIEAFKTEFGQSPSFIVVSKENYTCMIYNAALHSPNSNSFPEQFQGIPIVLVPGHEILETVGTPRSMFLYELRN